MDAILNLHDSEILDLITSSKAYYHQRVFSIDQNEYFYFDGIVFISECNCKVIGTIPFEDCNNLANKYCPPITYATGEIVEVP